MLRKILICCGIAAPVLYVITAIVGAALRNDYSHIVNAISEFISNGAPNKAILDVVFNIYNALLLAFAIGAYVCLEKFAASLPGCDGNFDRHPNFILLMGLFPNGPAGRRSYFCRDHAQHSRRDRGPRDDHHAIVNGAGVAAGGWFQGYAKYSFISSAIIFVSGLTGVILAGQGVQLFGLFERITIGSYEIWIFVTAFRLLKTESFNKSNREIRVNHVRSLFQI